MPLFLDVKNPSQKRLNIFAYSDAYNAW